MGNKFNLRYSTALAEKESATRAEIEKEQNHKIGNTYLVIEDLYVSVWSEATNDDETYNRVFYAEKSLLTSSPA